MVQETGVKWLHDAGIRIVATDLETQFTDPAATSKLVRQMLGSIYEFVGSQIKDRLRHGYDKALAAEASNPKGKRSCAGKPKLGGPTALMEQDPELAKQIRTIAKLKSARPGLATIAERLRKEKPKKWCVQSGQNKGKPWAPKQISHFLKRVKT